MILHYFRGIGVSETTLELDPVLYTEKSKT